MQGFPSELRPLLAIVIVLAIAHLVLKAIARKASGRSRQRTRRRVPLTQLGTPNEDTDAWQAGAAEMPIEPNASGEHDRTLPLAQCTPEEALRRLQHSVSVHDRER